MVNLNAIITLILQQVLLLLLTLVAGKNETEFCYHLLI